MTPFSIPAFDAVPLRPAFASTALAEFSTTDTPLRGENTPLYEAHPHCGEVGLPPVAQADHARPPDGGWTKRGVQRGHVKADGDPLAVAPVPASVVERYGHRWGTRYRAQALALGCMLHQARRAAASERREGTVTVSFTSGETFDAPPGSFVCSIQTVAEDALAVLRGTPVPRSEIEDEWGRLTDEFRAFYDKVKGAITGKGRSLVGDGLVRLLGYVDGTPLRGTVWTFEGTPFEAYAAGGRAGQALVDLRDDARSAFLDSADAAAFVVQECCPGVRNRGLYADGQSFAECVSDHTPDQDRHVTVGAWRPGDVTPHLGPKDRAPVAVPWLPLDLDRDGDVEEAFNAACRVLDDVAAVDPDAVRRCVVVSTGGTGFHVRIPSGLLGNPVYVTTADAERTLARFVDALTEERVDPDLLRPHHLVRVPGGRHPNGGRTRQFTIAAFRTLGLAAVLAPTQTQGVITGALDPLRCPPSEPLAAMVRALGDQPFWVPRFEDVDATGNGPGGAFARALEGCAEGETWWPGGGGQPPHVGRNKLCYVAACGLLRSESTEDAALVRLHEVAALCDPPLSRGEVRSCFHSARRTVAEDGARR